MSTNKLLKNAPRMMGTLAITIVVIASVGMNANYVFNNYNHGLFMMVALVATAICFDTLKALLLGWSSINFSKGLSNLKIALSQLAVWFILVSISVMIALANVADAVMVNPDREAEVKKIANKLNDLDHIRQLPMLLVLKTEERSKIDEGIIIATKNCTDITRVKSRVACQPLVKLRLEEVQSREKERLQLRYDQIKSAALGLDPTNAAMLISMLFLELTGKAVSPEKIDMYRIVTFALAIEIIAAMGYFLMLTPRRKSRINYKDISSLSGNDTGINTNKYKRSKEPKKSKIIPLTEKELKIIDDKTVAILENALKCEKVV